MPHKTCPHCQNSYSAADAQSRCPYCVSGASLPKTLGSRWFYAQDKKKLGPVTWQQLLALMQNGAIGPDDHLLQEGSKQWVQASSLPALFALAGKSGKASSHVTSAVQTEIKAGDPPPPGAPAQQKNDADTPPASPARSSAENPIPKPSKNQKRQQALPWLIILAAAGMFLLFGMGVSAGYYLLFGRRVATEPPHANLERTQTKDGLEKKPSLKDAEDTKKDFKKPIVEEKKPKTPPVETRAEQFVAQLNRQRKFAGLGSVALDPGLSAECQAHANYLARNVDPEKADSDSVFAQDPQKPGASAEGQRASQSSMIIFADPQAAFDKWMARIFSRAPLLSPEMQTIGIGAAKNGAGDSVCVVDPQRGRGEPIVFPAPKQTSVPVSFSGGAEVPDAKAEAGFPVTITFPQASHVTSANFEIRDEKGAALDGWLYTPEKPMRPANTRNTIAFVPRGLLRSGTGYQVKASAQLDGKPWNLAWSFTTEDDSDAKRIWARKVLDKVNFYRSQVGLKSVVIDDTASSACRAHARYLVVNEGHAALQGLSAHDEDAKLPGFSEEGRHAGKASNIGIGDYEPMDAVDAWMATLYHRVPILEPNLKSISFGCARGRRQGWVTVLDVTTGREQGMRKGPIFYPAPDQSGVPLHFPNGGEEPNPIPDDKDGRAGYPITAFFPENAPLLSASAKLTTDQGKDVACWFSSPDEPANAPFARHQGNTVCLIPKDPLAVSTTYAVHLQGKIAGKAWEKKWKFTTGAAGPAISEVADAVVQRLNAYRAQAGLGAVALDERASRGCQLHAAFLVTNADVLARKNAPVNDEDPLLPGYTAEGRRTAKHSMVFSNAPTPVMQIDDLVATAANRASLLDPRLERIGFGCALDVGRGWRCVLDVHGAAGSARVILFPAPNQSEVPCVGHDPLGDGTDRLGFPISVIFPRQATVLNVKAVLTDAARKDVPIRVTSPEKPLDPKLQRNTIGVHPLEPLQAGQVYSVTVSAVVDASEWRQTWSFTTVAEP